MPAFLFSLLLLGLSAGSQAGSASFDPAAVASIRARHHDCPRCRLAHADLTNLCVKHGNLEGADFDGAKGLTQAQLNEACGDAEIKLPAPLRANSCF